MDNRPKVTIIVTTYLESSKRYLDLCMHSIENLDYPKDKLEVILMARQSYAPSYTDVKTIVPDNDQYYPAEGINLGMKRSDPESKYFFILNDDTIATKNSLLNMVYAVGDQNLMANAISPCENGVNYHLLFGFFKNKDFVKLDAKQYRYDQVKDCLNQMMNADSLYPPGVLLMPYLCIFATLIPRKLYEAVGDWDENFKCGQDDLDYSWRAHQKGFQTVSILNSLIWHFSGVTADSTLNLKTRKDNIKYFKEKWKRYPPGIPDSYVEDE